MTSPARDQGDGGAGMDHISDLTDDLLLHVLRFLPDARDVVSTSALSTRWRCLWTRAPVLHIGNWDCYGRRVMDDRRFNDFVHSVLERRANGGADAQIDTLELRSRHWPGKSRADVWLRLAMRLATTSLTFDLSKPRRRMLPAHEVEELRARHSLPSTTRVTTMSLELDYATLLLPPAVEFHSLTDLTLETIWFADDDGPRLSHLLSSPSCCPRLRKLTLSHLPGLHDLRLDGGALETLRLERLSGVRRLDVDAPRLSALHVGSFFMYDHDRDSSISVRAPALEKLESALALGECIQQRHTIQLLQQCRPIHRHVLCLYVPERLTKWAVDELMTEIPQLPGVTNLTIKFCSENCHYLGATVSSLLARCGNLEYLHLDNLIHLYGSRCDEGCGYCDLRGSLKNVMISLEHLREAKLGGFSGKEHCCLDMVELLLATAPALEKMVVTPGKCREGSVLVFAESLESSLPCSRGKWIAHHASDDAAVTSKYEWTQNLEMLVPNREGDVLLY